ALRRAGEVGVGCSRLRTAFAIGLLTPAVPFLVAAAALTIARLGTVTANLALLPHFLALSDLYSIVAFPFESDLSPVVVPLTLGLWLTVIGSKPSTLPEGPAILSRYPRSALLWCACYLPVLLGLQYFPDRYKLHLLLPLAIAAATGLALLEQRGMHLADSWVPVAHGYKRRLAATLLGLPSGVLLGPALALVL